MHHCSGQSMGVLWPQVSHPLHCVEHNVSSVLVNSRTGGILYWLPPLHLATSLSHVSHPQQALNHSWAMSHPQNKPQVTLKLRATPKVPSHAITHPFPCSCWHLAVDSAKLSVSDCSMRVSCKLSPSCVSWVLVWVCVGNKSTEQVRSGMLFYGCFISRYWRGTPASFCHCCLAILGLWVCSAQCGKKWQYSLPQEASLTSPHGRGQQTS